MTERNDPGSDLNPYSVPAEQPILAELVEGTVTRESATRPLTCGPRVWTTFAVLGVSAAAFLAVNSVMFVVAFLVVHGDFSPAMMRDDAALRAIFDSRAGLLLLVVLPQLGLVIPAVAASMLSPTPVAERLGLVRGHWPKWAWLAAAAATPLVGMISGLVTGIFLDESESLQQMSGIFRTHGQAGFLIPLMLLIGATPAFCEELLFRGYIQTRLVGAAGPAVGILIASLLFAAFHVDPVHVIAVFPLGLFLGWVAWRSGSLVPAMLGHFVNNAISVAAVVLAPENQTDVLSLPTVAISLLILGSGIVGMTAVLIAAILYGKPKTVVKPV